jgi:hypothetical protein
MPQIHTHAQPSESRRRKTPSSPGPKASPARLTWKPIDFEGEDTSLTQDELALLK